MPHQPNSLLSLKVKTLPLAFCLATVLLLTDQAWAGVKDLQPSTLRADLAKVVGCPKGQVLSVRGFDVRGVRGVRGFSVGIYRKGGRAYRYAVVVIYFKQGGRSLITRVWLPGADSIAPTALVDLAARTSHPRLTGWHGAYGGRRSFGQRGHRLHSPALLVETRRSSGGHRERVLHVVSLKPAGTPAIMARVQTLSQYTDLASSRGRSHGRRRAPLPRFSGDQATSITFNRNGRVVEMIVTKRRTSTRYNRCRRPKPYRIRFRLDHRSFRRLPNQHRQQPNPC